MTTTEKDQIHNELMKGDITFVKRLAKEKGLNNGKGFSFNYIHRVLALGDRNNEELWKLAKQVIDSRKKLVASIA